MFEEEYEPNQNSVNLTSRRVYASRPIFFDNKEHDIKAHNLFTQLAKKKRSISKCIRLNEDHLFIEQKFSTIFKNLKDTKNQLIDLVDLQNSIIWNVNSKNDSTSLLLFTKKNQSEEIKSQNILIENDIRKYQNEINKINTNINVEKSMNDILKHENVNFKTSLAQIKVEHVKASSIHADINQKQACLKEKLNFSLKKKEELSFSHLNIKNLLSTHDENICSCRQKILQLESEYFIKNRVFLKLFKQKNSCHDSSNSSGRSKNELSIKKLEMESNLSRLRKQNLQIEALITQTHQKCIQLMRSNIDLEHQKDELVTMKSFLSEIRNNLENEEFKIDKEINQLINLIDNSKKEYDCLLNDIEEIEKDLFSLLITSNDKDKQYNQYFDYINNEINKIKNEINSVIKSKNKSQNIILRFSKT